MKGLKMQTFDGPFQEVFMKKRNIVKTFYGKAEILGKHIFLNDNDIAEINPQAPNNKFIFR